MVELTSIQSLCGCSTLKWEQKSGDDKSWKDCVDKVLLIVFRRAIKSSVPHFWLPLRALSAKASQKIVAPENLSCDDTSWWGAGGEMEWLKVIEN